jgi:hypothetical protein
MGRRVIPIPSGAARCCGSRLLRLGPGSSWRRRIHSYAGPSAGQIRLVNGRARCAKCAVRIGHFRINAKGSGRVLHARLAGQCHAWPSYQSYLAREMARRGDRDDAIPLIRAAVDHLFREGRLLLWGVPATGVLVQTLLDRGEDGDLAEADAAIERLATAPTDDGLVIREIWLLRLRALLARAHGDAAAYTHFRDRHRDMAKTLGYEGHIEWAEAMT